MRQLDDIVPPSRRLPPSDAPGVPPAAPLRAPRARFPYLTVLAAIVVVLIALGALFYFANATVQATPNTLTTPASGSYSATASTGTLPFEVITAQKVTTADVPATGTQNVTSNANGVITVYNSGAKAIKLISNTRFESASGLIFRIHAPVTVPAGGSLNPGSIVATVYADQPGSEYNIGATSFTVPGLSGTADYSQVTARSSTSMIGGASGTEPAVDPAAESAAVASMQSALAPELSSALSIPSDYVLLPGAATTSFEELAPSNTAASSTVELKEQGTITAVVFPSTALAAAIVSQSGDSQDANETFQVENPDSLAVTPVGALPSASSALFAFTLSGTADLVAAIDPTQIAAAVAGKSRAAAQTALANFPEIKQAVLILRPFWRNSFPEDPASIKVEVENPQAN